MMSPGFTIGSLQVIMLYCNKQKRERKNTRVISNDRHDVRDQCSSHLAAQCFLKWPALGAGENRHPKKSTPLRPPTSYRILMEARQSPAASLLLR